MVVSEELRMPDTMKRTQLCPLSPAAAELVKL